MPTNHKNADRSCLHRLNSVFNEFRQVSPSMSVPLAQTLVLVGLNEGKSLRELADIAGLKQGTISRYLLDLSERNRALEPGFGLVNRDTDPMELRKNMYTLTATGRDLLGKVVTHLDC